MNNKQTFTLRNIPLCPSCGSDNTGAFGEDLNNPTHYGCGCCGHREPYDPNMPALRQELSLSELKTALGLTV